MKAWVLVTTCCVLSSCALAPRGKAVSLFDGESLDGWTTLEGKPVTRGWEAVDGTLHRATKSSDIITTAEYGDFDLRFEFKIGTGSNSGLKYKFKQFGKRWLGCEYQIIDDGDADPYATHAAGALYDVVAPSNRKKAEPPGVFNSARVVVRGSLIQHWMNGEKILEVDTASTGWKRGISKSKFRDVEGFGKNARGRIMLQEHGGEVWFRKLELWPLE
jgi:hypothetical protein